MGLQMRSVLMSVAVLACAAHALPSCDQHVTLSVLGRPGSLLPGQTGSLTVAPQQPPLSDCSARVLSSDGYVTVDPEVLVFRSDTVDPVTVKLLAHYAHTGHIIIQTEEAALLADVQVSVIKYAAIAKLCAICGWSYFVAWSLSFYPQAIENYLRKSVVGLNFDFLFLNITGWTCYTAYNVGLYYVDTVQAEYASVHPGSEIPVMLNDVFFAIHAFVLTSFQIYQTFIYETGGQRVSRPIQAKLALIAVAVLVLFALCCFKVMTALTFLTTLSMIKLGITIVKYIPQAYMNYQRQSTEGWSIHNILLDFTGGTLSMGQMALVAYNTDDFSGFFGNPSKFGLGLVSVLFDVLFMVQHFVLYRHSPKASANEQQGLLR